MSSSTITTERVKVKLARRALPAKVKKLDYHLMATHPDSVVIPLITKGEDRTKGPVHPHKDLEGVGKIRSKHHPPSPEHDNWGILLGTDLCVIDFDNEEKHNEWLEKFPDDFTTGPWETTTKGHHYFFQNDEQYTCSTGIEPKVDFLAVENTGTRHVLQCAPTPGKKWKRNLVDTKAKPMSAGLKAHIADLLKDKRKPVEPRGTPAKHGTPDEHVGGHTTLSVDTIRTILGGLDAKKCESLKNWLEVCFLAKNTVDAEGSEDCLDALVDFCKPMAGFCQKEIRTLWYKEDAGSKRKGIPSWKKLIVRCGNTDHLALLQSAPPKIQDLEYNHRTMLENIEFDKKGNPQVLDSGLFMAYMNRFYRKNIGNEKDVIRVEYRINEDGLEVPSVFYRAKKMEEENLYEPFLFRRWYKSPDAKTFKRYRCLPTAVKEDEFNLMPHIPSQFWDRELLPDDEHVLEPVLAHIRDVFTMGDAEAYKYFLDWLALSVQKPGKIGVALLLRSAAGGVGKNMFFGQGTDDSKLGLIPRLFGEAFGQADQLDDLIGHFNASLTNRYFVCGDEVGTFDGSHRENNKMNGLINGGKVNANEKHQKQVVLDDSRNYVFLTNNLRAMKVVDGALRRWITFNIRHLKEGTPEHARYYSKLARVCQSDDTAKALYRFLMSRNIEGFNPEVKPRTAYDILLHDSQEQASRKFMKALLGEDGFESTQTHLDSNDRRTEQTSKYRIHDGYFRILDDTTNERLGSKTELYECYLEWRHVEHEDSTTSRPESKRLFLAELKGDGAADKQIAACVDKRRPRVLDFTEYSCR